MSVGKARRRNPTPPPPPTDDANAIEVAAMHIETISAAAKLAADTLDLVSLTYLRAAAAPDSWIEWREWLTSVTPVQYIEAFDNHMMGLHENLVALDHAQRTQPDDRRIVPVLAWSARQDSANVAIVACAVADVLRLHVIRLRLTDVDLHLLRLLRKSPATRDSLLTRMQKPMQRSKATVDKHLAGLADDDLIERSDGPRSPWTITPAGKQQIDYRDSH